MPKNLVTFFTVSLKSIFLNNRFSVSDLAPGADIRGIINSAEMNYNPGRAVRVTAVESKKLVVRGNPPNRPFVTAAPITTPQATNDDYDDEK